MSLKSIEEIRQRFDLGVRLAVAQALEEHKKEGRSIVVWEDGKVVRIPPEEIQTNVPRDTQSQTT